MQEIDTNQATPKKEWHEDRIPYWARLPAAVALAVFCTALSAFAPKAISETTIWAICEAACEKYGWSAIEFAPWFGFLATAIAISLLGRASYDLFHAAANIAKNSKREKIGKIYYTLGGALCVVSMIIAPSYTPDFIPDVVAQTSRRAAGIVSVKPIEASATSEAPNEANQIKSGGN